MMVTMTTTMVTLLLNYDGDELRIEWTGGVILEPENKLRSVVNYQRFHLGVSSENIRDNYPSYYGDGDDNNDDNGDGDDDNDDDGDGDDDNDDDGDDCVDVSDVSLGTAEAPHLLQEQQSPQRCLNSIEFSLI